MIMNLYILFTCSLPEAFCCIILFLLFAGEKDKLKINKPNVIRFLITLILMLVATNYIRPIAPNVMVNMGLHLIAYIIFIKLVYRIKFKYVLLSVAFTMLLYATVENFYLPYLIAFISKGIRNFNNQYLLFPLYAMPQRICQLLIIWFMWKHEIILVTRINKKFHKWFTISTYTLIMVEFAFLFMFYKYSERMSMLDQFIYTTTLCVLAVAFSLVIFKLVYNAIYGIVNKTYKHYSEFEENAEYAFNEVQLLLNENKVNDAINLIDKLTCKEKEINI